MRILGTKTFCMAHTLEEQAFKVCEESMELFQAVKMLNYADDVIDEHTRRWDMVNECADVLQATLNFFAMIGFDEKDIESAMHDCYMRNKHRGRVE